MASGRTITLFILICIILLFVFFQGEHQTFFQEMVSYFLNCKNWIWLSKDIWNENYIISKSDNVEFQDVVKTKENKYSKYP